VFTFEYDLFMSNGSEVWENSTEAWQNIMNNPKVGDEVMCIVGQNFTKSGKEGEKFEVKWSEVKRSEKHNGKVIRIEKESHKALSKHIYTGKWKTLIVKTSKTWSYA